MLNRLHSYLRILSNERHPIRFLLSRLLCQLRLNRVCRIHRNGYLLQLQPTGLSQSFFVDPTARSEDSVMLEEFLKPGDVYLDVGANIGHLAIEAALLVGTDGKVVAFEAHPKTCLFLWDNVRLNKLEGRIEIMQVAVGDEDGYVQFSDNVPSSADQNRVLSSGGVQVRRSRLDELVAVDKIALLKIDVEGYELFVLRGAQSLLRKVQAIYFEVWDRHFANYGYAFADVHDLLAAQGFVIYRTTGDKRSPVSRNHSFDSCENLLAMRHPVTHDKRTQTR